MITSWSCLPTKGSRLLLWMFPAYIISSTGVIFVPQAVCHLLSLHAHSQWLTGHRYTINYFFLFTVLQTSVNLQRVDFWFPVGLNHACCHFCHFASLVSCRATVKTPNKAFASFVIPQNMYSKNKNWAAHVQKLVCCGRGVTTRHSRFSQHAVYANVLSRSHSGVCIIMNTCCEIFQHAASCVLYWQVWIQSHWVGRGGATVAGCLTHQQFALFCLNSSRVNFSL